MTLILSFLDIRMVMNMDQHAIKRNSSEFGTTNVVNTIRYGVSDCKMRYNDRENEIDKVLVVSTSVGLVASTSIIQDKTSM